MGYKLLLNGIYFQWCSSWWLNQPIWNNICPIGSWNPKDRGENKKYLKPPPASSLNHHFKVTSAEVVVFCTDTKYMYIYIYVNIQQIVWLYLLMFQLSCPDRWWKKNTGHPWNPVSLHSDSLATKIPTSTHLLSTKNSWGSKKMEIKIIHPWRLTWNIPSWKLTYPLPRPFWRWFSFSQGGIRLFPGG